MRPFFGTGWEELSLEDVARFLADAREEGLSWEAKSEVRPESVRKAVCGFANAQGGFLIVGAERDAGGGWTLPGAAFSHPEPGTWIASVITDGLSPVPHFDVASFMCDGGAVVVAAVEPVAMPPCLTSRGVAYQRVTGQTIPITEQRVLGDLFSRGAEARERAANAAMRAARRALGDPATNATALLSVAICAVQTAEDIPELLFSRQFQQAAIDIIHADLQVDRRLAYGVRVEPHQDHVLGYPGAYESSSRWEAATYWDGSVSAVFETPATEIYPVEDVIPRVKQAWSAIAKLADAVGSGGEARLVAVVHGDHPAVASLRRGHPREPVRRWVQIGAPSEPELESITRELRRGFGEETWNPDPPSHI